MSDAERLLQTVLRTRGRELAPLTGLVDFVQESLPRYGDTLRLQASLRVWGGVVVAFWVKTHRGEPRLRIEAHHDRGRRGILSRACYRRPTDPDFGAEILRVLSIFRT